MRKAESIVYSEIVAVIDGLVYRDPAVLAMQLSRAGDATCLPGFLYRSTDYYHRGDLLQLTAPAPMQSRPLQPECLQCLYRLRTSGHHWQSKACGMPQQLQMQLRWRRLRVP